MARYSIITKNILKNIIDTVSPGVYLDSGTKCLTYSEIANIASDISSSVILSMEKFKQLDDSEVNYSNNQLVQEVSINVETAIVTYTVTFDSNGGSPTPDPQTVVSGNLVTRPTDPTKQNYTFNGWKLGNNIFNFNTPITNDITLVASWAGLNTYYIINDTGKVINVTYNEITEDIEIGGERSFSISNTSTRIQINTQNETDKVYKINSSKLALPNTQVVINSGMNTITEVESQANGGYGNTPKAVWNSTDWTLDETTPGANVTFTFTINYYSKGSSDNYVTKSLVFNPSPGYSEQHLDVTDCYIDNSHKPTFTISNPPSGWQWYVNPIANNTNRDNFTVQLSTSGTFNVRYDSNYDQWFCMLPGCNHSDIRILAKPI